MLYLNLRNEHVLIYSKNIYIAVIYYKLLFPIYIIKDSDDIKNKTKYRKLVTERFEGIVINIQF